MMNHSLGCACNIGADKNVKCIDINQCAREVEKHSILTMNSNKSDNLLRSVW